MGVSTIFLPKYGADRGLRKEGFHPCADRRTGRGALPEVHGQFNLMGGLLSSENPSHGWRRSYALWNDLDLDVLIRPKSAIRRMPSEHVLSWTIEDNTCRPLPIRRRSRRGP